MSVLRNASVALCLLAIAAACGESPAGKQPTSSIELNADTFAALRDQIQPSEAERAWQQIDWYPSYAEGLQAASVQQKPVLLWVMNGHPLGCT